MHPVVPRAAWGARAWGEPAPATVPLSARRWFIVHYDGGAPITATGPAVPRRIDAAHHANGWAGIGYNFVVDQAGNVFEGRGWTLAGAHCPGRNTDGIGVQVAIGGDQAPSPTALAAVRALYDEACRRTGRQLAMSYHSAHYATECPGDRLRAWVRAGMPAETSATTAPEDDMPITDADAIKIAEVVARRFGVHLDGKVVTQYDAMEALIARVDSIGRLVESIAKTPTGGPDSAGVVADAIVAQLGAGFAKAVADELVARIKY